MSAPGAPRVVDWDGAARVAAALVPPGPAMTTAEIDDLVAGLRRASDRAHEPVRDTARLAAPDSAPALVVDRPGWIKANTTSLAGVVDPILAGTQWAQRRPPPGARELARALTAAELGPVLAFVSAKVLGQFDVLGDGEPRLLLVAPNVAQVERALGVAPADFRLWVCLHEETHRVQFGANPWLRSWFVDTVRSLLGELTDDPRGTAERVSGVLSDLPALVRSALRDREEDDVLRPGLLDAVQTPAQRERIDALTAVMSLLEGHADVVMDEVGPAVVPSVATIRSRFSARRRNGSGPLDRVVRRLLGLDAKAAQYRAGAGFVRGVQDLVGVDGFNAVWTSPETLPRAGELADARAWVDRVRP